MNTTSSSTSVWIGGTAVLAGVGALAALAWLLPGTPLTQWRADRALLSGEVEVAAALYDHMAEHGWTDELRHRALDRSARVHAARLHDSAGARLRLERLLAVTTDADERAALRERLGWVALDAGDHPVASVAFESAHDASPGMDGAPERLAQAARQAVAADDLARGTSLWERLLAEHPERAPEARIALGRLALRVDDAQRAHALFTAAASSELRPDLEVAARLGAATALERLGSLDGAIAEIDEADLPSGVAESRLDALRSRRASREP